jgi:hypothetical protein
MTTYTIGSWVMAEITLSLSKGYRCRFVAMNGDSTWSGHYYEFSADVLKEMKQITVDRVRREPAYGDSS